MATNLIMRLDHMMHKEKLREMGSFDLRKKHLCGNSWENTQKAEQSAVHFSTRAHSTRTKGNRHKLQQIKF